MLGVSCTSFPLLSPSSLPPNSPPPRPAINAQSKTNPRPGKIPASSADAPRPRPHTPARVHNIPARERGRSRTGGADAFDKSRKRSATFFMRRREDAREAGGPGERRQDAAHDSSPEIKRLACAGLGSSCNIKRARKRRLHESPGRRAYIYSAVRCPPLPGNFGTRGNHRGTAARTRDSRRIVAQPRVSAPILRDRAATRVAGRDSPDTGPIGGS